MRQGPHLTQCVVGANKCTFQMTDLDTLNGLKKVREYDKRQSTDRRQRRRSILLINLVYFVVSKGQIWSKKRKAAAISSTINNGIVG